MKRDEPQSFRDVFITLRGVSVRIITTILFCLGTYFAILAWVPLFAPIGIILSDYKYGPTDIWVSILGSLLSVSGYWIWLGWLVRSWKQQYLFLTPKSFWLLAAVNHLGWLLYSLIPGGLLSAMVPNSFTFSWLTGNLYLSLLMVVFNPDKDLKRKVRENH